MSRWPYSYADDTKTRPTAKGTYGIHNTGQGRVELHRRRGHFSPTGPGTRDHPTCSGGNERIVQVQVIGV